MDCTNNDIIEYLKQNLKPKRLAHTYAVADEAARLAERYGADENRAREAALFHDMCKGMDVSQLDGYVKGFGLPEELTGRPNLSHGKVAAELMRRDYNITDEDMINAVAFHTTGRAGMSLLEKIVFLADAIEPGRDYPGVDEIRILAYENIDEACAMYLTNTLAYLSEKGEYTDPDTVDALEYLKGEGEFMIEAKTMAVKIAKLLDEKKAVDVTVIDISPKASFADYFVMASAGSERQMDSLVDNIEDMLEPEDIFPKSVEGKRSSGWILMDYGDVVVNVMTVEMREKYNIERIWGDCETVDIN